jgi:catechol 2,3-dioxygenase-like lactoylglutathione lyase family enzyme
VEPFHVQLALYSWTRSVTQRLPVGTLAIVTGAHAPDIGLSHVALPVKDVANSVAFYARYAGMVVVHERVEPADGTRVVWLGDLTRPFVVVLIEGVVSHRLGGVAHLGVGCASRAEVDDCCATARAEGREVWGPMDSGAPVGYWAIISDPDGHNLELSYGQEVRFIVEDVARPGAT